MTKLLKSFQPAQSTSLALALATQWLVAFATPAASSAAEVAQESTKNQFAIDLDAAWGGLNIDDSTLYAFTLGVGGRVILTPEYGLGFEFSQGMQTDGTTIFSGASLVGIMSLAGSLSASSDKIKLGDTTVLSSEGEYGGGLRARLYLNQLFYNGPRQVYSFAGPGAGLVYEFPASGQGSWSLGARGDWVGNDSLSLLIFRLSLGYSLRY